MLAGKLLDFILPPSCFACAARVDRPGGLCSTCWQGLTFITPPLCACCGFPFEADGPGESHGTLCGRCLRRQPLFDTARAALVYNDGSRGLLLAFKHGDRHEGLAAFTGWLRTAAGEHLAGADLILPVPLHPLRLFKRRFNQAALLAAELSRGAGVPWHPHLLRRKRATPSQGGLNYKARFRNVRGAFSVPGRQKDKIRDRSILLIDDVMTTGATLEAASRALKRAGAGKVHALALARVVRPARDAI